MDCHKCGKVVLWEKTIVNKNGEKRVYHIQCWDKNEEKFLKNLLSDNGYYDTSLGGNKRMLTKSGKTANFSILYKADEKNPIVIHVMGSRKKATANRIKYNG